MQTDPTPKVKNGRETRRPILPTGKKWPTLPEVHDGPYFGTLQTRLITGTAGKKSIAAIMTD